MRLASVVIAVRGDVRVMRALHSLGHQTVPRDTYQLIVIENGSSSLAASLPPGIDYAYQERANMAAARNMGLAKADSTFVLFTDADCVPERNWIETMTAALAGGDFAGIGGRIERYQPRTAVQRFGANIVDGQTSLNYLPILDLPYVVGANSGFHRDSLLATGGFDEDLLSGNDVDVCYKLGLRGRKLGICPEAVVYHDNRPSAAEHFFRFFNYALYQVLLHKKYRAVSGKKWIFNSYPYRLFADILRRLPASLYSLAMRDVAPFLTLLFRAIEALGVILGDVSGSLKHKVVYI
jgi:GT2 family glycosyltransferase